MPLKLPKSPKSPKSSESSGAPGQAALATFRTRLSSLRSNLRRASGPGQKIAVAIAMAVAAFGTGCDFTREAYCHSRAHGECRQLFNGDCFSATERGTLIAQNPFFSPELLKGQAACEKAQNTLCLERTSTGDSTGYIEPDIDRALCAETIDAVACVDFKAVVVELDGIPVPEHLSVCLDAVEAENP
jgi:hypothetical protein